MNPLPCPFCGDTSGDVVETSTFRWRAWVCSCGVVGPEIRIQTMGDGTREEWEATAKIRAIEAWNMRAADNSPAPLNVDGIVLSDGHVELIGTATQDSDTGKYRCLANIEGALCVVEIKVTPRAADNGDASRG